MAEVMGLPAKVLNYREEARGCLQLAKAEPHGEVRTILMGMALGWLNLANHPPASQALQIEHAEI